MLLILKNLTIDLILAIWGFVFAIQGIIIFSVTPVYGGLLLMVGLVISLIGGISYIFVKYNTENQ
jgi:hypothetical protein